MIFKKHSRYNQWSYLHPMMNKSLTPYLHCTRLWRFTASTRPPELIVATHQPYHGKFQDRHLYFWWIIIIIIVLLSSKASATGIISNYRRYTIPVFPNPVTGGTPTEHILNVSSFIWPIYFWFWSLYWWADELIQVCLIRKGWKMCSVGVPPGTGLGNTALYYRLSAQP